MIMPKVGYLQAYGYFWKYYAEFSGRTTKDVFWKTYVINQLIYFALSIPAFPLVIRMFKSAEPFLNEAISNASTGYIGQSYSGDISGFDYGPVFYFLFLMIYFLVTLIPSIAVYVRRFNDIDRNGAHFFLLLIPLAGIVIMFVMLTRPSAPYDVYPGQPGGPYPYEQRRNTPYPGQYSAYGQQNQYGQSQYGQAPQYGQGSQYGRPSPYNQQQQYQPPSQYTQQPYGQQTYYQQRPRSFSPYGGGNDATTAIILAVVLYVVTYVHSFWANSYYTPILTDIIDDFASQSIAGLNNDSWNTPTPDYGFDPFLPGDDYYDEYGDYDDYWNYELTEEEQAAVDIVRHGTLEGLPDYTIEEVLLSRVDEDGLDWSYYKEDYDPGISYYVTTSGFAPGTFDWVYADFTVMADGRIVITNLMIGDRDEYDQRAKSLFSDWYRDIQTYGGNARTA